MIEERQLSRKGLKKFLGKRIWYEATYQRTEGRNIIIFDIHKKGTTKILSDHLWIDDVSKYVPNIEDGDKIQFLGIATSYIDSQGERKYSITGVHRIRRNNDLEDETGKESAGDYQQMLKRKKQRKR